MAGYAVFVQERARIGGTCTQTSGGDSENDNNKPFCAHEGIHKAYVMGQAEYKQPAGGGGR